MDIFVVDDERIIAETLAIILRGFGYDAIAFCGALPALKARALRPKLLLTDYNMPDLDGVTLIRRFLADQQGIAAILFTGNDGHCSTELQDYGRDPRRRVLIKPLAPERLLEEVAMLIGAPSGAPAGRLADFQHGTPVCGAALEACSTTRKGQAVCGNL
ncbi:two-component system, chemotaxis family, response regulator CheY [Bryocella elongata]|uniref:Two-component system, chemotaxis family, response regulator CheY n=1 Tax=Bryocella elongata TaxID=863522 RepID=A0A1H5ZCT8_9BACT|nr:response regulator [Bryocella elongata]SEG33467.1 two-component system, chemotaxis family, response regulator CheY [Bryocella elongata]